MVNIQTAENGWSLRSWGFLVFLRGGNFTGTNGYMNAELVRDLGE